MFPEAAIFFHRLRAHLQLGPSVDSEIVRELETHVEDSTERLVLQGVSEHQARHLVISRLGRPQTLAHLMRQAHRVTPWHEALFAAAPLLLVSMLIGVRLWQHPAVAVGSCLLVVAVTLYGLSQGRPAWFYSWAGVALTLPLIAGYIAFAVAQQQIPQLAAGHAGPSVLLGVAGAGLYFPVGLLVVVTAVLVAARRDWLDASVLLSPLPGVLVWIIAIHHAGGLRHPDASVIGTSELLGVVYLCMASSVVAVVRSRSRPTKIAIILGAALLLVSLATPRDSQSALLTIAIRASLLMVFLLSPALMVRRALRH